MKKKNNIFLALAALLITLFSCNKKQEMSDLDKLRTSSNKTSYPVTKMDSAKAIQYITKQKIQEFFDLSTLYTHGNRDTEIDSVIYAQMCGYFEKPDSLKFKPLLRELESLQVKTAKVGNIEVYSLPKGNDTLDYAKFSVEYSDKNNQSLGNFEKKARYVLKLSPVKFKKEFKFYFVEFEKPFGKDSTAVGKTR